LLAIAALAGCKNAGPPAAAYRDWKDRLVVAAGMKPFFWPCQVKEKTPDGVVYGSKPTDQCFKMQPERIWRGMWRNQFEGSRFCPAPTTQCQLDTPGDIIWLQSEQATKMEPDGTLYSVDLLGRRTAVKGQYMGGSDHVLIVDRFISMKEVGPPLTQAESAAALKRCDAGARCSAWQN
jgi:hypothetical protein